jgi:ssRNA-specific RNase YbeY (16S rRNA maturation enzyme)
MTEGAFGKVHPDLLGDVVISVETAARQARVRRADVRGELALLLIHGILHLVGYDHGTARGRRRMWQRQRTLLEACGLRMARRRGGAATRGKGRGPERPAPKRAPAAASGRKG